MQNLLIHPLYSDYACDESGNVYSLKYGKVKQLKPAPNTRGYLQFNINFEGKGITKQVHAFIFECCTNKTYDYSVQSSEGLTINHIDENKINNKISNLEIITNRENLQLQDRFKIKNKKSGLPRFVCLDKNELRRGGPNPYKVKIYFEGKYKHFGYYSSIKEAEDVARTEFKKLYPNEEY